MVVTTTSLHGFKQPKEALPVPNAEISVFATLGRKQGVDSLAEKQEKQILPPQPPGLFSLNPPPPPPNPGLSYPMATVGRCPEAPQA